MDDILKHYGIKGMRWGVSRNRRGTIREKYRSLKRERSWYKMLKNMDKMNTKDINNISRRVSLENELKLLSKSKIGTSKDKIDYLRRANMGNSELSRKVNRLRAKDKLHKSITDASREQREFGFRIFEMFRSSKS